MGRPSPKASSGDAQETSPWERIFALRLLNILLIFAFIAIVLFVVSYLARPHNGGVFRSIPWSSLAGAALSVVFIGFGYEWFVRKEADARLRAHLKELLEAQTMSLPQAFWTGVSSHPTALALMRDEALDDFVVAALGARLRDENLARGWYENSLSQVLRDERQRHDYRVTVNIEPVKATEEQRARATHFDIYIHRRYETRLFQPALSFVAVDSSDNYQTIRRSEGWDVVSTVPPRSDFPTLEGDVLDRELYELEYVRVNDIELETNRIEVPERLGHIASHNALNNLVGDMVTVDYRYRHRIRKRRHTFTNYIAFPTNPVSVKFEFNTADIELVDAYPLLTSHRPPTMRYTPSREEPRAVEIEVLGWVLPGSGVVFGWQLAQELTPSFEQMLGT